MWNERDINTSKDGCISSHTAPAPPIDKALILSIELRRPPSASSPAKIKTMSPIEQAAALLLAT